MTSDKELTAKVAENYGSLSLALEERQKSRAKRSALARSSWRRAQRHEDRVSHIANSHFVLLWAWVLALKTHHNRVLRQPFLRPHSRSVATESAARYM